MAVLIAAGTIAAQSADFTLTDGQTTTLFLTDAAGESVGSLCTAYVQIKDASNQYFNVGQIDGNNPAKVLAGAGTYRVSKDAGSTSFGVDRV